MGTVITYNVCRNSLGEDTTDAQYKAFKSLVESAIEDEFPDADVIVGDSDFCNESTCHVDHRGPLSDDSIVPSREDVEEAAANVDDSWWDAE